MEFQLSAFYKKGFLSYLVKSDDKLNYNFYLKSSPPGETNVPELFTVSSDPMGRFTFDRDLDEDLKESIIKAIKKNKL